MAGLGLGRRAEDRRLELVALDQTCGEFLAGERAASRIFLPCRARDVAADHAFDRKHVGALAQHRAAKDVGAIVLQRRHVADDLVGVGRDHVMRHHAFELPEPVGADLGQHCALHRNGLGHHHIEGADAVGGEQEHAVLADGIDVAHLAAPDLWQGQVAGAHRGHRQDFQGKAFNKTRLSTWRRVKRARQEGRG